MSVAPILVSSPADVSPVMDKSLVMGRPKRTSPPPHWANAGILSVQSPPAAERLTHIPDTTSEARRLSRGWFYLLLIIGIMALNLLLFFAPAYIGKQRISHHNIASQHDTPSWLRP